MRNPTVARSHAYNPQMGHFYGAAPMALLTVGAGAVLVGRDLIGMRAAVDLDWVLWTAGTLGGLFTAMSIPYLMFTQYRVEADAAFGGWLMPVVPPMVSAATGALLIPHMAPGTGRQTMLYGCYAMFGLSLVASLIIITMVWSRLAHFGTSGTARVPTLWIVLGPLGQSITAAGLLGTNAALAVDQDLADGMGVFAILYGVPVWGFAVLWIALATALTVRTAAPRHAVRADMVEPDVPGRDIRHRHHAAGHPYGPACVPRCRRHRLRRAAEHLVSGGDPNLPRWLARQHIRTAADGSDQGAQGSACSDSSFVSETRCVAATDPLISNVSDTARWVATYRAVESARPDALFHDRLADRLAGDRGRAIVAAAPRAIRSGWWLVARTKVMDDVIIDAIADGCDRVLNLAAGLDTRPYRLDLPPDFTWIEADLPELLAEKEQALADETPGAG